MFFLTTTLALAALYVCLTALRIGLALRYLARQPATPTDAPPAGADQEPAESATVLQAILSGDPLLEDNLRRNLLHHPSTDFVWLLDETDAEAQRLANLLLAELPAAASRVRVLRTPPVPQGLNPKVFKLKLGLPYAGSLVVVLDDDTVLLPGAVARACAHLGTEALVTGLPYYTAGPTVWSALVMAFVNANALITYLPTLYFQPPVTINGMFYALRKTTLLRLGGFAAIETELCDDYAVAQLYRRQGLPIVQTTILHPIATSVFGLPAYLNIMRRWMVFARRLFKDSLTPPVLGLVVLPSVLPLVFLTTSLLSGSLLAVAGALAAVVGKALALARLRRRVIGTPEGGRTVALEVLADLLQPAHMLHALLRPRHVQWRNKSIELVADGLRYV